MSPSLRPSTLCLEVVPHQLIGWGSSIYQIPIEIKRIPIVNKVVWYEYLFEEKNTQISSSLVSFHCTGLVNVAAAGMKLWNQLDDQMQTQMEMQSASWPSFVLIWIDSYYIEISPHKSQIPTSTIFKEIFPWIMLRCRLVHISQCLVILQKFVEFHQLVLQVKVLKFMTKGTNWMWFQWSWKIFVILLMAEILHQLIGSLFHYLQGFIHPRWCINSRTSAVWNEYRWLVFSGAASTVVPVLSYPYWSSDLCMSTPDIIWISW